MLSWAGVVLAGLLNGSFAVPLKTTRVWRFNHIWTLHSLLAMGVIPWAVVMVAVPGWHDLLTRIELRGWLILIGWGVLFGIASLLYGVDYSDLKCLGSVVSRMATGYERRVLADAHRKRGTHPRRIPHRAEQTRVVLASKASGENSGERTTLSFQPAKGARDDLGGRKARRTASGENYIIQGIIENNIIPQGRSPVISFPSWASSTKSVALLKLHQQKLD